MASVADNGWSEQGITWNNQPATQTILSTWIPTANTAVQVPVTAAAQEAMQGDQLMSLGLYATNQTGDGYVTYATKEHATSTFRPTLTLTYLNNAPLVNVRADTPTLAENSNPLGTFTLTRTGDLAGPLTVQCGFGGTASINDFTPSSTSVTFAAGQASAVITIDPVNGSVYEGNRTITLTVLPSMYYTPGSNPTASMTLVDDEQSTDPFIAWLDAHPTLLSAADRAATADPDRDGWNNRLEFALHAAPDAQDAQQALHLDAMDPQQFLLTIAVRNQAVFRRNGDLVSDPIDGIVYRIQGSRNLQSFQAQDVVEIVPAQSSDLPALATGWSYRTFAMPRNGGSQGFLRVAVEAAP